MHVGYFLKLGIFLTTYLSFKNQKDSLVITLQLLLLLQSHQSKRHSQYIQNVKITD